MPARIFARIGATCLAAFAACIVSAQSTTDWRSFWPEDGDAFVDPIVVRTDGSGNSYVAGSYDVGDEEYAYVQKYDTNGVLQWTASFDALGPTCSCPNDMQIDAAGNAYVVGHAENLDTSEITWMTFKVSPTGSVLWSHTEFTGELNALQIGPTGHVYVTGYALNLGNYDIVTRKYASNGNIIWTKSWNGSINTDDGATSMGMDAAGNLYVGGYSQGSSTGPALVQRLIKYAPTGARLWTKTFGLPGVDTSAFEVIARPDGGCFVASQSRGADWSTSYVTISSHDTDGNPVWRRKIDTSATSRDEFADMAMVQNQVTVAVNIDSATSSDILTRRYDPAGNVLWSKKYAPPGDNDEYATAIGVTATDTAYVAGVTTDGAGAWQSLVMKYSPGGTRLWDSLYGSTFFYATAVHLAIDGSKAVVVGANQTDDTRWASMIWRIH